MSNWQESSNTSDRKNSKKWKIESYLDIANKSNLGLLTNIISMADNMSDIDCSKKLAEKFNNAILKSLKFKDSPNLDELNKEISLVCKQFHHLYNGIKNMSIKVGQKRQ